MTAPTRRRMPRTSAGVAADLGKPAIPAVDPAHADHGEIVRESWNKMPAGA